MGMEIKSINDLQRLCNDKAEETTSLEFKTCSELIIGSKFWDNKSNSRRSRTRDDVLDELSKDVTALLNSNGGMIIYGIREKKSKANEPDTDNAFNLKSKETNIFPEKVVDWIRAHILPPPIVNVASIPIDESNPDSAWFLIIEVQQGQTAYQARNKLFYRRVSATIQPMEQYEVHDVMNRAIVPDADVKFSFSKISIKSEQHEYRLNVKIKNLSNIVIQNFKLQFEFPNYGDKYINFKNRRIHSDPYFGKITFSGKGSSNLLVTFRSIEKLFPKDEFDVGNLLGLRYIIDNQAYLIINGSLPSRKALSLKWVLYADNMQPKSGEIPFSELHIF